MTVYAFTLHPHGGDNCICTGAVHNVCVAHPDVWFLMPEQYDAFYANNPNFLGMDMVDNYVSLPKITYGGLEQEKRAEYGSCVEAYTRSLCNLLGIPMVPLATRKPMLYLTDEEKERSKRWQGTILLNANCQTCSLSKGYPHWQSVIDGLQGRYRIVQIGGNEARDLSLDLVGVEDMRGKTTLRDLIVMAYGCLGVISPPSCITNICGAFDKPQIVLNASREPDRLTDYVNAVHISHRERCGWGITTGCVHCRCGYGTRACHDYVTVGGRQWCRCQWETAPERVVEEARRIFG